MKSVTPHLPFSSTSWLSPRRVALCVIMAFASVMTLPAVWWIPAVQDEVRGSRAAMAMVVLSTGLWSLMLALRALKAKSVENGVLWCVLGGIVAGVLNAGSSLALVEGLHHGDPGSVMGGFILGVLVGGFYGGPLGLVFGVAYSVPVASALSFRHNPSHDGPDRVLLWASSWLVVACAIVILRFDSTPSIVSPWLVLAMGCVVAVYALQGCIRRRVWFNRVVTGRVAHYSLEPRSENEAESSLLPVFPPKGLVEFVVMRHPNASDPYRQLPTGTPVALAQSPSPVHFVQRDYGRFFRRVLAGIAKATLIMVVIGTVMVLFTSPFVICVEVLSPIANLQ